MAEPNPFDAFGDEQQPAVATATVNPFDSFEVKPAGSERSLNPFDRFDASKFEDIDPRQFLKGANINALSPGVIATESAAPAVSKPTEPLVQLPQIGQETVKSVLESPLTGGATFKPEDIQKATGVSKSVQNFAEGLTSPLNISLAGLIPGAPSLLQKGAALAFAGQAAKAIPESISQIQEAQTPEEKAQAYTDAALNGLVFAFSFGHAAGRVSSLPEGVVRPAGASQAQINEAIRLAPEPAKNAEIPDEMLDGLVAAKDAAAKAVVENPQNETLRRLNAANARQLKNVPEERVAEARARLEVQRQQTPPAEPAAQGGTEVPSVIPPTEGGRSSLFTQAMKEAGVPQELPTVQEVAKEASPHISQLRQAIAEEDMLKEFGGTKEQLEAARQKRVAAEDNLRQRFGSDSEFQIQVTVADRIKAGTHKWVPGEGLVKVEPAGPETPQAIAGKNGVTYQGETNGLHAFKDPETGGNFSLKTEDVTPQNVASKLAEVRKNFSEQPNIGVGEATESDVDRAIREAIAANQAQGNPTPLTAAVADVTAPKTETPVPEKPAMTYVEAHRAALKAADQIAADVARGQPDTVREAARDAAHRHAINSIDANPENPQFNPEFMRREAMDAAGKAAGKQMESLDQPSGEAERTRLKQTPSEAPSPDVEVAQREFAQKAVDVLASIGERAQEIIQRVVMGGETLDAVGKDLGITRERVRQIRDATLEKIRSQMEQEGYAGGPGAMGPVEALEMAAREKLVSIKNAFVDASRIEQNIPAREIPLRRSFGRVWDEARAAIDAGDQIGRDVGGELVDSLKKKVRPLTDLEDAILTHEQLDRQGRYDEAVRRVNESIDPAEKAEAQAELQRARDRMYEVYDVGQKAGTENARGLNARRMIVKEDYSLAKLEARARAANNGEALSEKQLADLKAAHEKIAELEKKLTEAENKGRDDLAKQYFDKLLEETRRDVKQSIKEGKTVTDFISDQAQKARERIAERRKKAFSDPFGVMAAADIADHAIIGADYIAKGFSKLADWSGEMVKDFGEKIRPYLPDIFEKSKQYHDAHEKLFAKETPKAERTPEQITASIDAKKGLDHQTVYDLARAHVKSGVEGFENVMKAVREDLKTKFPDITQREVNDAFSEYGKVKFPSKEADRVKLAEYRRIGQLQSAIEDVLSGKEPKKTGMQRNKPTQEVRELMAKLKDTMDEAGIDTRSSEAKLAGRLDAYKTRLKNATEDLQKRLQKNDYTKPVRQPLELDKEAFKLKADYERAKEKVDQEVAKIARANKTPWQRFWDHFVGVERAMKLSSDVVLGKLTLAALAREGVLTPVEEGVGGVLSKTLPRLAERAPREGGFSLAAEMKAKAELFTRGMADALQNLKFEKSDLDTIYGKRRGEAPPYWYEYLGYLHAALKAPVKRAEFTRSLAKRMEFAEKVGRDLSDPNVMAELSQEAYVDANRSIFMQDNVVSSAWEGMLRILENSKKAPNLGPGLARLGRFFVPIVKVGTNLVGETLVGTHGLVTGGLQAIRAYAKGIDELPAAQADQIMRYMKKGAVGNALLLYGYYAYKNIGGFHTRGDKRDEADVQSGYYRVGGTDLPPAFSHSTAAMLMNIGATAHRLEDSKAKKGFGNLAAKASGLGGGIASVAHEVPFVPAVSGLSDVLQQDQGFENYIHQLITSSTTPALTQHVAKLADTPGSFPKNLLKPAVKRSPQTAVQAVEMGIPGLRQRVPQKKHR